MSLRVEIAAARSDIRSESALAHEPSEPIGLERDTAIGIEDRIRCQQVAQRSAQASVKRQIALMCSSCR
jgi:hypothetical protein